MSKLLVEALELIAGEREQFAPVFPGVIAREALAAHRASSLVDDAELRKKLRNELDDVLYALLADCGDRPGHISRILRIIDEHTGRGGR